MIISWTPRPALRQRIGLALSGTLEPCRGLWLEMPSLVASDLHAEGRNINLQSIGYAFRPRLRVRLTLGRLTLPRNPWAYGERVFRPFCRYSSLHYLFQALHWSLQSSFAVLGMLAYRSQIPKDL